ncbi:MAG: hypothetical protein E7408_01200 [Ruminococcaceae bacterium]|nr:hypothetical protein [Oscillospiraceae bacterium]
MEYNVENWLKERGYKTSSDGTTLSVTDKTGASYALDTAGFSRDGTSYKGSGDTIRAALGNSGAGGPAGYTPLRNTLAAQGVSVGYDATADAPIVGGQMLNKNDSRLVKVGDDYWIEENYAKSFMPKKYENPYADEMSSLLSELRDMKFSYTPTEDKALRAAQDQAMLAAKQSANARGLLGGSTAEIMRQRAAQELVPAYEQLAYNRYLNEREGKIDTLSLLGTLADNAFSEYLGKENLAMEKRQFAMDAQSEADTKAYRKETLAQDAQLTREQLAQKSAVDRFTTQLDKVIAMGEVDEEAAEVLGLVPGTLTRDQLQFIIKLQEAEALAAQERTDALAAEEREWNRQKELLKLETDEKIRAAYATK